MRGPRHRLLPAVAVLALVAVLAPGCSLLDRKSYTFPRVAVDVTVNQDGSLSIVERRTFDFRGEFHFAFFTVEHKQFNDVVEFSVREGEHVYEPGRPGTTGGAVFEDNVLEGPGGFKFKATWWFDARDERRTFIISYRVRCAVDPYQDTAHLLWKFIGEGWTVVTDFAVIAVHLPGEALDVPPRPTSRCIPSVPNGTPGYPLDRPPRIATSALSPSEVRAWGHGPLQGAVRFARPQKVVLSVSDVPPATFVEGSVLFPLAAVPYLNQPEEPGRQRISRDEAALAAEANAARRAASAREDRADRWRRVAYGVVVGLPALFVLLVLLGRRRDRGPGVPPFLEEPPEPTLHPAELATHWSAYRRKRATANAYRAQLLRLANERAIDIVPLGTVTAADDYELHLRGYPEDALDAQFTNFLFEDGRPTRLRGFRPNARQTKVLRAWWKAVTDRSRQTVPQLTRGGRRFETATLGWLALSSLIWGPVLAVLAKIAIVGFPALVFLETFGFFVLARRILPKRLRGQDAERMARWSAFRRYLADFSSLPSAPTAAVVVWGRYLVYAIALDVAKRVEKQVRAIVPEAQLPPPWPGAPAGFSSFTHFHTFTSAPVRSLGFAAIASGMGTTRSSGSSGSWSSSSGSGGGFSSGGGGGGGGTGGGAG